MHTYKKPLGRSIAFGCVLFTAILCLSLSILNYYNQRDALYRRYESHITDILRFVDSSIDGEALKFEAPNIRTDNEVESLSKAITQMTEDMQDYVSDILSAEEKSRDMKELADAMHELAIVDALTGIRNKTAYTREAEKLERELQADREVHFGLAMIDLNFLKVINDSYGHEKGDEALRNVTKIICTVFSHSPVFRVGGDEFIVILRGQDYDNIDALTERFCAQASGSVDSAEPWTQVSASIGVALYDKDVDKSVDDVLKRADQAMYEKKKEMKAVRLQ